MKAKIENERMIVYLLNAHRRSVKDMGNKRSLNEKIKPLEERHWICCFKYRLICLGFTTWRPMTEASDRNIFLRERKNFQRKLSFFFLRQLIQQCSLTQGKTLGSNKGSEIDGKCSLNSPQVNIFLTTPFTGTRSPVSKWFSFCRSSALRGGSALSPDGGPLPYGIFLIGWNWCPKTLPHPTISFPSNITAKELHTTG